MSSRSASRTRTRTKAAAGHAPRRAPKTRREAKERSREALIEAALSLFAEEGIDASLDAICERAGYTRGAFYVHFADREALLAAAMAEVGTAYLASLFREPRGRSTGGLRDAIEGFVASVEDGRYPLMAPAGQDPRIKPHQLLAACARSPQVRAHYRDLVSTTVAAIQRVVAADDRVRKDVRVDAMAEMTIALVIGTQTMAELGLVDDGGRRMATALERVLRVADR